MPGPQVFFLILLTLTRCVSSNSELPSLPAAALPTGTAHLERDGKWWAQVGDRIYHAPRPASGLSEHVSHYYYALGSESALPEELRQSRVGGQGRLHLFHIPPDSRHMQTLVQAAATQVGSRRSSLSSLQKLSHGINLSTQFPLYKRSELYENPLAKTGHLAVERSAVGHVTPTGIYQYLTKITQLPDDFHPTRSSMNATASKVVQAFLQDTFQALGLVTCSHSFYSSGNSLTNIIGYVPGTGTDTVTLGAHYDSIPASGAAPGAEDNGSGLAVLLMLAEAFKKSNIIPRKTVYFVAFAGEEQGLLGSAAFVGELVRPSGAIPKKCQGQSGSFLQRTFEPVQHEAIIMDEVGWQSTKLKGPTVNLEGYDWASNILEHLAQSSLMHNGEDLTVVHSNNPFGSDHMSFLDRAFPAVLTINGDDEAYPNYHQSSDTIVNVNKTLMHLIGRMNMGALLRVAGVRGVQEDGH
eukprot:CAMPEP_0172669188 /NCGR_PEP_ID=MMETSP1074-20121228/9526_1 /TAXON_ID=2916 /ORGANISM="Ceratium fusus, Strain PA161109" /LENGTH=466 /DNA_ID=CAMNT_0013485933 /DNA_START=45 /DNA_END=1445 /DNA_ORIENTATION=+